MHTFYFFISHSFWCINIHMLIYTNHISVLNSKCERKKALWQEEQSIHNFFSQIGSWNIFPEKCISITFKFTKCTVLKKKTILINKNLHLYLVSLLIPCKAEPAALLETHQLCAAAKKKLETILWPILICCYNINKS